MTEEMVSKMFKIAEHLRELNSAQKVKRFGNDKGHAKVFQIRPGCSVWTHHLKNNRLIIDLMITRSARQRYPEVAMISVDMFKEFFHDKVDFERWHRHIDDLEAERYFVDIGEDTLEDIFKTLDKIKDRFSKI